MLDIPADLRDLVKLLVKHRVRFALCGGHAVAFYGFVRATMDLDILVLAGFDARQEGDRTSQG